MITDFKDQHAFLDNTFVLKERVYIGTKSFGSVAEAYHEYAQRTTDTNMLIEAMRKLVFQKFAFDLNLRKLLVDTGTEEIKCETQYLGNILTETRELLKKSEHRHYTLS